ncbi:MAG: AAA family ATPase [Acidimicrobiia bacterium]|nr:AAA family ATPase [Acidimicrobiia bacterium]
MIEELRVVNLGVIADTTIEPSPGLVVVTGETGAGKTMLLGALRLLLGENARAEMIGPHGEDTRVEGRFRLDGVEAIAARRITGSGRSRAYLDGAMVAARTLGERLAGPVELVGQHDHLLITRSGAARRLIDESLDAEGREATRAYREAWAALQDALAAQAALGGDRRELERELDLVRHQAAEIVAAGLDDGEEEHLAVQAARLRYAEELDEELSGAYQRIEEADGLGEAVSHIRRAAGLDVSLEPLAAQAAAVQDQVGELRTEIRATIDQLERDPAGLEAVELRIASLGDLKRKYGETVGDIIEFGEQAAGRADHIEQLLGRADQLESELSRCEEAVTAAGERLRTARRRTAKSLASTTAGHLRELGFSDPVVAFDIEPTAPSAGGADAVELLFSSDSAIPPAPARRSASGGELSRLVLSLRLAAGVGEAAVVAFDEIDAGIGGATALAMGEKLRGLADGRQVLCVTHLPQVAAFATQHLVVERDGATARVRPVVGEERVGEIARMLSGLPDSKRGQQHAGELLELGGG